jgi:benzodiazapine receptor
MHSKLGLALGVYGLHMALGNWWNVVFFGRRQISGSIKWMMAFWASTAGVRPCVCIRDGVVIATSQAWGRKHTSCLMLLLPARAGTIAAYAMLSTAAAALVAPTLIWVTIAQQLNIDIKKLNPGL